MIGNLAVQLKNRMRNLVVLQRNLVVQWTNLFVQGNLVVWIAKQRRLTMSGRNLAEQWGSLVASRNLVGQPQNLAVVKEGILIEQNLTMQQNGQVRNLPHVKFGTFWIQIKVPEFL